MPVITLLFNSDFFKIKILPESLFQAPIARLHATHKDTKAGNTCGTLIQTIAAIVV